MAQANMYSRISEIEQASNNNVNHDGTNYWVTVYFKEVYTKNTKFYNIKISQMEEQEEMSTQENLPKVSPEIILNSPQIESMIDQIAGSIVKQNQNVFLDGVDSADINALNQMINQLVNSALSR